jgi:O-antigen ligase
VAAAGLVAAAVAAAALTGEPAHQLSTSWAQFKRGQSERRDPGRLTSAGSNRYDFWRVALDRFAERPVFGVGADNFQQDYLARRKSDEEPRYPHSVELRTLLGTGLVGALILVAALIAAGIPAVRAARRDRSLASAGAAAGAAMFAYWLLHGSVDWFWEIAGLGVPAFAMLGLACAAGRPEPEHPNTRRNRAVLTGPVAVVLAVAAGIVLCVSFALPWVAARDVDRAAKVARFDPAEAADRLSEAGSLNPLSSRPAIYEATIALAAGRMEDAAAAFQRALDREPRNGFAALELGAIRGQQGRRAEAVGWLRRAVALSPRDPVPRRALAGVQQGHPVDVAELNRQIVERVKKRYVFNRKKTG